MTNSNVDVRETRTECKCGSQVVEYVDLDDGYKRGWVCKRCGTLRNNAK